MAAAGRGDGASRARVLTGGVGGGSYCPAGSADTGGVPCPVDPARGSYCCAGGTADKELCPIVEVGYVEPTPPPVMCNWWDHHLNSEGVGADPLYRSVARQGDAAEGWLEGAFTLPVPRRPRLPPCSPHPARWSSLSAGPCLPASLPPCLPASLPPCLRGGTASGPARASSQGERIRGV